MLDLAAPQLVVHSRMIFYSWLPAEPDAVAALVPPGLRAAPGSPVFLNQYVVDDATQTSGFGAYSLTYLGVTLAGADAPDGITPGGWWTHYLNSSDRVRRYARARGAPVGPARTTVDIRRESLVAVTEVDGAPLIRTRARVGHTGHQIRSGQHRYLTARDGQVVSGVYPYIAEPVDPFEIESVEFCEPGHPVHALRPANPLTILWGFYSPRASFAYPGGETVLDLPAHQVPDLRARSGRPSGS